MTENHVVDLFLTVRVFLVGGILLVLPRITRKGLLFGVYVGEAFVDGAEGRSLLSGWRRAALIVMAASLAIGLSISMAGYPVTGNLTGTAVLILAGLGIYFKWNAKARRLAPVGTNGPSRRATATLLAGKPSGEAFVKVAVSVVVLVTLATITFAGISYRSLPAQVPALSGPFAVGQGMVEKSALFLLYAPCVNALLSLGFVGAAWMIASAKLSVREGTGHGSVDAQLRFRRAQVFLFSGTGLMFTALMTAYSVQLIRIKSSEISNVGGGLVILAIAFILYAGGSLGWLVIKHGQGGALRENGSTDRALSGALADNTHWYAGVFYVNREDPSLIIENRVGLGYTMNYGNPMAVVISLAFTSLALLLAVLAFFL